MSINPAFGGGRGGGRGRGRGRGWIRGRGRGRGGMNVGSHWAEDGKKNNAIGSETHPKKQESKTKPKISERYNEEDADVSIISSDNVLFKVHSFPLARASPVFKSMLGIAQSTTQRDPITMTDPHVELSIVINATLDILYDREVHSFSDDSLYQHVLEFARKWDVPIIIKTILKELRIHATSSKMDSTVNSMFRLTLDIGDHDAIVSLVKAAQGRVWTNRVDASSGDSRLRSRRKLIFDQPSYNDETERYLKGSSFYEFGSWPYSKFAALPPPIVWAILRAASTVEASHVGVTSDSLPSELKKILRSMYPNKATQTVAGLG